MEISKEDIHELLDHFSKTSHKAKDGDVKGEFIMEKCLCLISKDYKYSVIPNFNGELCCHYPNKIVLMEYELSAGDSKQNDDVQSIYDVGKLRELFKQARFARCRSRFVAPVILFEGKNICRSATLSGGAEMYGRSGFDFFFFGGESIPNDEKPEEPGDWQLFDKFRGQDKKLLNTLSVKYICDLMVENKKVKFGMNVTSSEKADKEKRYADFHILSLPYPGCEFFKEWHDSAYCGSTMFFDWNQGYVDAQLILPDIPSVIQMNVDWQNYKSWNLIQLTQNYIRVMLNVLKEGDSGLLIHCISGWDRTPLFISLLRLSLWADGACHASLSPVEILFLTLGYDWYLFGHSLNDRLNKGEEIFFFCFYFLRYLAAEEFSVNLHRKCKHKLRNRTDSDINFDGVLLDPDSLRYSYRGSNTSINSTSSGSIDNGPITFNANVHDEVISVSGNSSSVLNCQKYSPVSRGSFSLEPPGSSSNHSPLHQSSVSTSIPMAVPKIQECKESKRTNSPSAGSWQIISSYGSLRGYGSSHDSPASHSSSTDSTSGYSSTCPCCKNRDKESGEFGENSRWQKLDSVRRIFHNAYTNKITMKHTEGAEGGGGGISILFDHFAEKVGIRSKES